MIYGARSRTGVPAAKGERAESSDPHHALGLQKQQQVQNMMSLSRVSDVTLGGSFKRHWSGVALLRPLLLLLLRAAGEGISRPKTGLWGRASMSRENGKRSGAWRGEAPELARVVGPFARKVNWIQYGQDGRVGGVVLFLLRQGSLRAIGGHHVSLFGPLRRTWTSRPASPNSSFPTGR